MSIVGQWIGGPALGRCCWAPGVSYDMFSEEGYHQATPPWALELPRLLRSVFQNGLRDCKRKHEPRRMHILTLANLTPRKDQAATAR